MDCDLTSGEQQEETLDPAHSVMLSSQKTEDVTERATTSGIPGTASNLPQQGSSSAKGTGGVSRRTENVTYQTSRIVRHTKIPQGVIRRMSLAVLVDQTVQWDGQGNARRRVLVPPAPETLKTIHDLVAGVTGFNAERGDQLIVETLPFETSLHAEPPQLMKPVAAPAGKSPAWLEFATKYRDLWAPVTMGLGVLLVLIRGLFRFARRAPAKGKDLRLPAELEAPAARTDLSPAAAEIAAAAMNAPGTAGAIKAPAATAEENGELAERVRLLAKREPDLTVNVLRMWLQESKT